jgi:Zn-dependent M32 family carboxypeptidase
MDLSTHDPRDIPILTDAVERVGKTAAPLDTKAIQSALLAETFELAETLLNQAAKDIEATLFERVLDRLRAQLPELVDRVLREYGAPAPTPKKKDD